MACLPASVGDCVFTGGGRRLLPVEPADFWFGHIAVGYQSHDDNPQASCPGNGLWANAGVLLDRAGIEPAHRCRFPDPDGNLRHVAARSLSRVSFLYE